MNLDDCYVLLSRRKLDYLRYKIGLIILISISLIILLSTMFMLFQSWFWVWFIILYFVLVFAGSFIPIISVKIHQYKKNNSLDTLVLGINDNMLIISCLDGSYIKVKLENVRRIICRASTIHSHYSPEYYTESTMKAVIIFVLKGGKRIKTYFAVNGKHVCKNLNRMIKNKNYDLNELI